MDPTERKILKYFLETLQELVLQTTQHTMYVDTCKTSHARANCQCLRLLDLLLLQTHRSLFFYYSKLYFTSLPLFYIGSLCFIYQIPTHFLFRYISNINIVLFHNKCITVLLELYQITALGKYKSYLFQYYLGNIENPAMNYGWTW